MLEEAVQNARYEDHVRECDSKYKEIVTSIETINDVLSKKADWSTIQWMMGILVVILLATFGYIIRSQEMVGERLDAIYSEQTKTKENVARIWGKLEPFNVEFKD